MNIKITITIVVPIYNVENYLDRCINSLINQTYKNIEIILVDDGSTDNCPNICDRYAEKDKRIRVIHKKNGGLSDARNVGIGASQGEYILFVDSDDYIELDACEKFIESIRKVQPDIVVGNANRLEKDRKILMEHTFNSDGVIVSGNEYLRKELKSNTMYMAAWLNLYKKSFLSNNNLKFKVGLLHEDEEFTPRAFLKADRVVALDYKFYNYIIRENSITTMKDLSKNSLHMVKICKILKREYDSIQDKELKKLLNDNLVRKYFYAFQMSKIYKNKDIELLNKLFLITSSKSIKNKIKLIIFITNKKLFYNLFKV